MLASKYPQGFGRFTEVVFILQYCPGASDYQTIWKGGHCPMSIWIRMVLGHTSVVPYDTVIHAFISQTDSYLGSPEMTTGKTDPLLLLQWMPWPSYLSHLTSVSLIQQLMLPVCIEKSCLPSVSLQYVYDVILSAGLSPLECWWHAKQDMINLPQHSNTDALFYLYFYSFFPQI